MSKVFKKLSKSCKKFVALACDFFFKLVGEKKGGGGGEEGDL
jgi:hypothetical protein